MTYEPPGSTLHAFHIFLPSIVLNWVSVVCAVVAVATAPDRRMSLVALIASVSTSVVSVITAALPALKILRDLSAAQAEAERAKIREELSGLRSFLGGIVQGSPDAILEKDLNGTIRSWSKGAETLFGWPAPEIVGQNMRVLTPEDKWAEEYEIIEHVRIGSPVTNLRTARRTRDGRRVEVTLFITPIRDTLDRITGAVAVMRPTDWSVPPVPGPKQTPAAASSSRGGAGPGDSPGPRSPAG